MLGYVAEHASRPGRGRRGRPARPPALLTPVSDAPETGRAIAEGADLIDVTGLSRTGRGGDPRRSSRLR